MKECAICKDSKPLDEFPTRMKRGERVHFSYCRPCDRERNRAYKAAKPEAVRASDARKRERHAEKISMRNKRWREENAERLQAYYAENKQRRKETTAAWQARNKHRLNESAARRDAQKVMATPAWADIKAMREFYFAADFLGMVTGEWHEVDHIVPIMSKHVCGFHAQQNMRVIPRIENHRKGNRYWPDMP